MVKANSSSSKAKSSNPWIGYYLLAYNILSCLGWSYILLLTFLHLTNLDASSIPEPPPPPPQATEPPSTLSKLLNYFQPPPPPPPVESVTETETYQIPPFLLPFLSRALTTYTRVGSPVTYVQSFAILEIIHVLFGLVKSALITTFIQVFSRIYLIWGILSVYPDARSQPFFTSMIFAWSSTEIIRYAFYATTLVGKSIPLLTYLRYTAFYILYPIGALSETALVYSTLPSGPFWKYENPLDMLRFVFVCIWVPGLGIMMMHMQAQRKKVLGHGKKSSSNTTTKASKTD